MTDSGPGTSSSPPARPDSLRRTELLAALGLTAIILGFHVMRLACAGGLWRDEVGTANLAADFSVKYVVENAQHELFPVLVPAALHVFGLVAGRSDSALRLFGALVGLSIIGVLWLNLLRARGNVPLLSLALLGFNAAVVEWGDTVRGYGPGMLLILLSTGLLWKFLERPAATTFLAAAASSIASVQCLFNNAALLLALCLAAATVAVRRGRTRQAAAVLLLGFLSALTLLPYLGPIHAIRQWDMLVRVPTSLGNLLTGLLEALSASSPWSGLLWMLLFAFGLGATLLAQTGTRASFPLGTPQTPETAAAAAESASQRDLLLYCGTALFVGLISYLSFLKATKFAAQVWYYLALLGFAASLLELAWDVLCRKRWQRYARLGLVFFLVLTSGWSTWTQVRVSQTNVDRWAAALSHTAARKDLVVVVPWYRGLPFARYYQGAAAWTTLPPLGPQKVHRYDLVKRFMLKPDQTEPVKPVLDLVAETLKSGHHVWVLDASIVATPSGFESPLSPAPDSKFGWLAWAYEMNWSSQLTAFLRTNAVRSEKVGVSASGPVNLFENLRGVQYDGWREQ